jgi:ABC-type nickel/cobalt efflux system permease component RcnA
MSAQDLKFVRLLSATAAMSLGVSLTVAAVVVAAAAILERVF